MDIRGGIAKLTEDRFRQPGERVGLLWDKNFNSMLAQDILQFLHENDVVRKVERELPEVELKAELVDRPNLVWKLTGGSMITGIGKRDREIGAKHYQQSMLEAGYVAVEPLIQEVDK